MVYRTSVASNIITESDIAAMFSGSLSEDEDDDTLVEHPSTPLPPQSPPPSTPVSSPLPPQSPPPSTPVTVTTRRSTRKSNKESRSKGTTSTSKAKQPQLSTSAAASSVDSVSSKGRSKSGKKSV